MLNRNALPEELRQELTQYLQAALQRAVQPPMDAVCAPAPMRKCAASASAERAMPDAAAPFSLTLEDLLKQEDAGFSEKLLQLIDSRGKRDSEIYKRANLSRQHFSKIRNDPHYRPTKSTALALAVALELDLEQTKDLIGRAGYALSNSSKFDLIVRFFIQRGEYDLDRINLALYEFDQNLLGN